MRYIALVIAAMALQGCVQQSIPSPEEMKQTASQMRYFKDAHGLCYAEVQSYSYSSHIVVSIANVPCDAVGL